MSHQAQRLAELSIVLAARQEDGERLWGELKQDILHRPKVMHRYCACMRLCEWLKHQIQKMA